MSDGKKAEGKAAEAATNTQALAGNTAPQATSAAADDTADVNAGGEILFQQALAGFDDRHPDAIFDKAHVLAHPEEVFHHVGDGFYKRGTKPKKDDEEEKGKGTQMAGSSKG